MMTKETKNTSTHSVNIMSVVMIDRVEFVVHGGDGGNGCVSFRREKWVPMGGPDGGDGGDGGSVIFETSRRVRTLQELGRRRIYRAERGQHGHGSDKHGRRGESLVLKVPMGTVVSVVPGDDEGDVGEAVKTWDLVGEGEQVIIAKGGGGGWGNARFATSVRRAPRFAQRGGTGDVVRVVLDLKLLADVGIAGLPNAGKSTLLRAISAARPKVADYPFTTLEANLGVVERDWKQFVVADIPGLIEGAHEGAGLGLDFLRHIERTRTILHLVSGASDNPLEDMAVVNDELREYGHGLESRIQIVAINKIDIPEVRERIPELEFDFRSAGLEPYFISGASGEGVEELLTILAQHVAEAEPESIESPTEPVVLRPQEPEGRVRVVREEEAFRVHGERAVAFAEMMPTEDDDALAEVWNKFTRWGIAAALKRAGAKRGDAVLLGEARLEMRG